MVRAMPAIFSSFIWLITAYIEQEKNLKNPIRRGENPARIVEHILRILGSERCYRLNLEE